MNAEELPRNWKEQVERAIGKPDIIFLEYFIPDLRGGINREPISAFFINRWAETSGVTEFSRTLAIIAGKQGIPICVADTARTPAYFVQEMISIYSWNKNVPREKYRHYTGYDNPPDELDFEMATAVDSRRLMTARALMQEALRMREKSIENPEIVCVTPKAHADRIIAYIERQINAEMAQGKNIERLEDLENTGEARDIEKAKRYKRTIGLETAIRCFSPQEPPYVYELSECIH